MNTSVKTPFENVSVGDSFSRLENGTIVALYHKGDTVSKDHHDLLFPNKPYVERNAECQYDMAILKNTDGRYTSVSSRIVNNMSTNYTYSAAANKDKLFDIDSNEIVHVTKTELIKRLSECTSPCALVFRKQAPDWPESKHDDMLKEITEMGYLEFLDKVTKGPMRFVFGQKPTNDTIALITANKGRSYRDQSQDNTRAISGYAHMIDYSKSFPNNLIQVNYDKLLAFVDLDEQVTYVISAKGKVTKKLQNRILDHLRQGISEVRSL
jgi:hypothetical protein